MESTLPPNSQPKRHSSLGSLIVLVLLIVASLLLWANHQYFVDTINFWRYQPTSDVSAIASKANLSDSGRFIFYASEPAVDEKAAFNQECERKESGTAILGCYVNQRIFLYNVTDTRLDGIEEVTAAHEMLHAVYERMSQSDRSSVNTLVEAEYQKLKSNPEYAERMAFYDRTEPGERDNELHSIIGTEVASISPELEAHYDKYFNKRSDVVGFYASYNSAFTSLANQAKAISTKLDSINIQIKSTSDKYNADVKTLNTDISDFNGRAAGGSFTSQAQFNAQRDTLVTRANTISSERDTINGLIDQYNTLRGQYNDIVTQSNALYNSIDSSLAPAPKV
ncbi:MAG: hypothetical protein JWO07_323 [Candidatus Saccharibacteria bacterium]|nr:hypothetical protein [Candidatus Saccharibacteria bacterium]